jgi:oxygen-independent coproporphyrinogen-3 oxidase
MVPVPQLDRAVERHRAGSPPWALFERRVRTPRAARGPLPRAPVADACGEIAAALDHPGLGCDRVVYVHIPFCRSLCSFCGYCREIPVTPDTLRAYVAAVRQQLASFAARPWTQSKPFSAIHFGGGTPTLLPTDVLAALIRDVAAALPLAPGAEITVESTVAELESVDVSVLMSAGMNRLALGVQTFDGDHRRSLGRRSSREKVLCGIAHARAAGITNLCVDLIYGLPNQTLGAWKADLEILGTCGATGASIYPLVAFPASELGRKLVTERRDSFVDLATEYEFFMAADRALLCLPGWTRFSPVQYGHASVGTAAYVSACGRGAEILALGAGAAGTLLRLAYFNSPSIEEYTRGWSEGGAWPIGAGRGSDAHDVAGKLCALGETTHFIRAAMPRVPVLLDAIVARLVELGLATTDDKSVSLTSTGCFWAGNICEILSVAVRN